MIHYYNIYIYLHRYLYILITNLCATGNKPKIKQQFACVSLLSKIVPTDTKHSVRPFCFSFFLKFFSFLVSQLLSGNRHAYMVSSYILNCNMCVCVCVCVRARVCIYMHAYVCVLKIPVIMYADCKK